MNLLTKQCRLMNSRYTAGDEICAGQTRHKTKLIRDSTYTWCYRDESCGETRHTRMSHNIMKPCTAMNHWRDGQVIVGEQHSTMNHHMETRLYASNKQSDCHDTERGRSHALHHWWLIHKYYDQVLKEHWREWRNDICLWTSKQWHWVPSYGRKELVHMPKGILYKAWSMNMISVA